MNAPFSLIISEIVLGSLSTIFTLIKVLIPLMIVIELLHTYKIMEKLSRRLCVITKILGISPNAVLPLLIATVMGITFGAGTLIEVNKRDPITKKDLMLIAIFFFICHAVIETTVIWGNAGANIIMISAGRLLFAVIFTAIAARLPMINKLDDKI